MSKWIISSIIILTLAVVLIMVMEKCDNNTYEDVIKDDTRLAETTDKLEERRLTYRERFNSIMSNYMPN